MRARLRPGVVAAGLLVLLFALSWAVPGTAVQVTGATGPPLAPPSRDFPLGTDENGLSVLALTLYGARRSLLVGVLATLAAVAVGASVGVLAGHFSGWPDAVLGRVTEWFLVLPSLPLAITLGAVLGPGIAPLVIAIAATSWAAMARVTRAAVISVESEPYLERSRALGAGHRHLLRTHVLPAIAPVVAANTTLNLASALLSEAALSFLGLGEPGLVSWGSMLRQAGTSGAVTAGAWWYLLAPGCAITAVVLACSVAGRLVEPGDRSP